MAYDLNFKAACEMCHRTIRVRARDAFNANLKIADKGWSTEGTELKTSKHYCPIHTEKNINDI